MKLIINTRHGGFSLSQEALEWLMENKNWKVGTWEDGGYSQEGHLIKSEGFEDYMLNPPAIAKSPNYIAENDILLRSNRDLLEVVETLGEKANGKYARLKVVDIPNDADVYIHEYDGLEWVCEKHRTWS